MFEDVEDEYSRRTIYWITEDSYTQRSKFPSHPFAILRKEKFEYARLRLWLPGS